MALITSPPVRQGTTRLKKRPRNDSRNALVNLDVQPATSSRICQRLIAIIAPTVISASATIRPFKSSSRKTRSMPGRQSRRGSVFASPRSARAVVWLASA
jgi:hypothetical protein